jgi:hypothetical protein
MGDSTPPSSPGRRGEATSPSRLLRMMAPANARKKAAPRRSRRAPPMKNRRGAAYLTRWTREPNENNSNDEGETELLLNAGVPIPSQNLEDYELGLMETADLTSDLTSGVGPNAWAFSQNKNTRRAEQLRKKAIEEYGQAFAEQAVKPPPHPRYAKPPRTGHGSHATRSRVFNNNGKPKFKGGRRRTRRSRRRNL